MRYRKGSLNLNRFQDKAILCGRLALCDPCTAVPICAAGLLRAQPAEVQLANPPHGRRRAGGKQALPMSNGDALYSITRAGIQALEHLGIYYLGANCDREQDGDKFQMAHVLEVTNIRLALLVHHQLFRWILECFIRILNLSPATAYAKVYDGIANVRIDHGFVAPTKPSRSGWAEARDQQVPAGNLEVETARAGQVGRSDPAYGPAAQNQPDSARKTGDETQSAKAEEGAFAAYHPQISPVLFSAKSLSSLECGGDDGTRTRGLCRDRAAF
jgi:hypothetical protein